MDYTPNAEHLAKWQWEIIRYPALFTDPFGGDEEGEYSWIIIDEKHTKLFNHVYINNLLEDNNTESYKTDEWDKEWQYSSANTEDLVNKVIKKIKNTEKDSIIGKITLADYSIYTGKHTVGGKEYPTAIYSRKKEISNIKKVVIKDLDELKTDSIKKHLYCESTYTKYLVLAFYEEGEDTEPVLMIQAAKNSIIPSNKHLEAWMKYIGVLEDITDVNIDEDALSIIPVDLFERQADKNCYETCVDIIKKYDPNYQIPSYQIWALATKDNEIVKLHKDCYAEALIALDNAISSGIPIIVGVDYKKNDPAINFDKITDHWVIINGKGSDNKGVFYTYFEVAQPNDEENNAGTSTDRNRFYVNEHNQLIGLFPTVNGNENTPVVTSIRIIPNNKCCSREVYEKINDDCTDYYIHKTNSKGSLIEIKR
jgi:uncharacterized LabA/DUF88 family protein